MEKSRLLMKEQPLVVDRTLAKLIGLNEALVLQQIEYWVNIKEVSDSKNKKTIDENYVDGYYWTYNTISEWNEEFPFWSYDTVKRTLKKLKDKSLVVTGTFNKKGYDRTLWYRVNHKTLIDLDSNSAKCTNEETSGFENKKDSEALKTDISANCPNAIVQNAPMQEGKMHSPIPKTSTKTSTKTSISSSKGKPSASLSPLVELFNSSICTLKKTTTVKFMNYVEKYDNDFIESVISYCEGQGAKTFSYFDKTIQSYIVDGITTAEGVEASIGNFRESNKKAKNRAIKEKEEAKSELEFEKYVGERAIESMTNFSEEKVVVEGEDIDYIKEVIKFQISDVSYNTWIKELKIKLNENKVVCFCPNEFTREIIEKKYFEHLLGAIKANNIDATLKVVVAQV